MRGALRRVPRCVPSRRRSRLAPAVLAVALAISALALPAFVMPTTVAAAPSFPELCTQVASVAGRHPGVTTGVVVMDLETGDRCAINADRSYRSASLYKLVVVAELYRQVEEGDVELDDPLVIEPRHAIDDPPSFRITASYTTTVYDAAERMITFSDNATAFALRELLGIRAVDDATEWLGMPATSLGSAFVTSANDQAEYLRQLYEGDIVSPEASEAILELMLRQEIVDMIPQGLPEDVEVAHKTGTLSTFLHDSAIVFAPGGDFVLVAMTEHSSTDAAMEVIQEVAATTYEAYAQSVLAADVASRFAESASLLEVDEALFAAAAPVPAVSIASDGSTTAPPPTVVLDERPRASSPFDSFADPVVMGAMGVLALLAVAGPAWLLRRRPAVSYGDAVLSPEDARLRADRSERGLVMRFGSRRDDESRPTPPAPTPASYSVAEAAEQPVLPSRRLQRVAEHFRAQSELLGTMRDQFEDEMEPLHELIVRQAQAMQALLQNLEDRLRPLNEYADGEEANLSALEERIRAGGQDHVARSFSTYLTEQRRRIDETREQIDHQRMPFIEYGDAQRETVETALQRFDSDIEALEANLAEQRRVMMRMLDAMRSESFTAVRDYLEGRQQVLADLAAAGSTDPTEISQGAQALRADLRDIAAKSDHVRNLLEQAEAADRALAATVPSPRPLREQPEQVVVHADEPVASDDEEKATG